MSDSLSEILQYTRRDEPPEIGIIKSFVFKHYKITPQVAVRETQVIIGVPSAALAGTLRMHLHELEALCQTKKRLVIRIS